MAAPSGLSRFGLKESCVLLTKKRTKELANNIWTAAAAAIADCEDNEGPPPLGGRRVTWNELLRYKGGNNDQDLYGVGVTCYAHHQEESPPRKKNSGKRKRLESLDSETQPRRNDLVDTPVLKKAKFPWNDLFKHLVKYHRIHGHCRVSIHDKDNGTLCIGDNYKAFVKWVDRLRQKYLQRRQGGNKDVLSDAKFDALQSLLVFATDDEEEATEEIHLPSEAQTGILEEHPGKFTSTKATRAAARENTNVSTSPPPADAKKTLKSFKKRFVQLLAFKEVFMHLQIPRSYDDNVPGLYRWVKRVRQNPHKLTEEQREQLQDLGLGWPKNSNITKAGAASKANAYALINNHNHILTHKGERPNTGTTAAKTLKQDFKKVSPPAWKMRHQQLQQYGNEHGNFRVPKKCEDFDCYQWVRPQPANFMLPKREDKTKMADRKYKVLLNIDFDASGENGNNKKTGDTRQYHVDGAQKKVPTMLAASVDKKSLSNEYSNKDKKKKALSEVWVERIQQLREYHREHGDFRVPIDYVANPALGKWVRVARNQFTQRLRGDKASIADHKYEALQNLGFDAHENTMRLNKTHRAADSISTSNSNASGAAEKNGEKCNKNHGKKGTQVMNGLHAPSISKAMSKNAKNGKRSGKSLYGMKENSTNAGNWDWYFEQLKQYQAVNGHCKIKGDDLDADFAAWVKRQRDFFTQKVRGDQDALPDDNFHALKDLGFEPRTRHGMSKPAFAKRLAELIDFKAVFGHSRVPSNYRVSGLRKWVVYVRQAYERKEQGQESEITQEHIDQLESVGFEWHISSPRSAPAAKKTDSESHFSVLVSKNEDSGFHSFVPIKAENGSQKSNWPQYLKKLASYKDMHGTIEVPLTYEMDQAFADWVAMQQQLFSKKAIDLVGVSLSEDRFRALGELDFLGSLEAAIRKEACCVRAEPPNRNDAVSRLTSDRQIVGVNHEWNNEDPVKQEEYNPNQISTLQLEGALPDCQKNDFAITTIILPQSFTERVSQLKDFYGVFGHCKIPKTHNPGLRDWVTTMRHNFQQREEGDASALFDHEWEALQALDFDWLGKKGKFASKMKDDSPSMYRGDTTVSDSLKSANMHDVSWHGRLKQLERYKEMQGHLRIPVVYETDQSFSNWFRTQKRLFSQRCRGTTDAISDERFDLLKSVGLESSTL